jgi:hypothetical protein
VNGKLESSMEEEPTLVLMVNRNQDFGRMERKFNGSQKMTMLNTDSSELIFNQFIESMNSK